MHAKKRVSDKAPRPPPRTHPYTHCFAPHVVNYNTLQHTATQFDTLVYTKKSGLAHNTLQHTATH